MSDRIAILTDSNSGLTIKEAQALGVHLVSMPIFIDGEMYFEEKSISHDEFFEKLSKGAEISTSQPSPGEMMETWDELLEIYDSVIFIPMSSGLSGTCATAKMLAQEYEGKVFVIDNKRISVTMRQSVLDALTLSKKGKTAKEIADFLEEEGMKATIYVAVDTLEYLKKGGRVTAAAAAIGSVLKIKPVLTIQGGKLDAYRKVRGMKQAMEVMIQGVKKDMEERFPKEEMIVRVTYNGSPELGQLWQKKVQESFPEHEVGLDIFPLSISCHVGPGSVGIGCVRDITRL